MNTPPYTEAELEARVYAALLRHGINARRQYHLPRGRWTPNSGRADIALLDDEQNLVAIVEMKKTSTAGINNRRQRAKYAALAPLLIIAGPRAARDFIASLPNWQQHFKNRINRIDGTAPTMQHGLQYLAGCGLKN